MSVRRLSSGHHIWGHHRTPLFATCQAVCSRRGAMAAHGLWRLVHSQVCASRCPGFADGPASASSLISMSAQPALMGRPSSSGSGKTKTIPTWFGRDRMACGVVRRRLPSTPLHHGRRGQKVPERRDEEQIDQRIVSSAVQPSWDKQPGINTRSHRGLLQSSKPPSQAPANSRGS